MTESNQEIKSWRVVCLAGWGIVILLAFISSISTPFKYDSQVSPPILTVSFLLFAATALAFVALKSALRMTDSKQPLLFLIVCIGISLRAIGLFTTPILEVDYYRYIWDGKVTAEGVSPYAYSPAGILGAEETAAPAYREVVALSMQTESNFSILKRIHFADYRTIYPPVSQFVFACSMKWFPHWASVEAHVLAIKAAMVLFDLATMWLIYLMLKLLNFHRGWLIAYAWNPLVIKEVSNSGHVDSIVAFFIIASVYFLSQWIHHENDGRKPTLVLLSGIALGFGVGAKLFPVVLFPALVVMIARIRWSTAVLFALSFAATSAICLWPMYHALNVDTSIVNQSLREQNAATNLSVDTIENGKDGLSSFLSQWRMNDVIFSGIYHNLKPAGDSGPPWFVVTSERFRQRLNDWCQSENLGNGNSAFLAARILTMALFVIFYLWQLKCIYRGSKTSTGIDFARLTWICVVFLFLQPTVNPWYWIWIAPLACLSRNAGWVWVAGLLLLYYSRFWFQRLEGCYNLAGTNYSGAGLFDHGIAWIEFACITTVLICFARSKTRR